MDYISRSEKETYTLASDLARKANPGDVFALEGELGSGKTTFVKGFAKGLGVGAEITSPTFVLLKKYPIKNSPKGIKSLIHVDCYRMGSVEDAIAIGLPEFLEKKDSVILLEWSSKIKEILPKGVKHLEFKYVDENNRKISVY